MIIALASPPIPSNISDGLWYLKNLVAQAAKDNAQIICFPESFLPGYPGMGYLPEDRSETALNEALQEACSIAKAYQMAIILPMDWYIDGEIYNLVQVISPEGNVLGHQTKNQLDPSEDAIWKAGKSRQLFELNGLKFGITICHEGFRYPESVRWASRQGAHIVFHPHFSGSDDSGITCQDFAAKENPYYERAMMMRALENTIFFASVNYASKYQESASAVIAPDGTCLAHQPYGESGVLTVDIDINLATGLLAKRFKPELFL